MDKLAFKYTNCILFVLFLFTAVQLQAQKTIEFGVFIGASNYSGDVSEQEIKWDQTHPSFSVFGRYNINQRWSFKGFVGYGKISGADSLALKAKNKIRNTNFNSVIYEFSGHFEYNLVKNNMSTKGRKPLVPYLFAGIGIFHFNPKTEFQGKSYELQPLGTEGQGTTTYNSTQKYNLTTVCLPMGIGLKKRISANFAVGIEFGARFTFTNYLDDVGGKYASTEVVKRAYGPVAGSLSNRTAEVASAYPELVPAVEGNPRTTKAPVIRNDMYFIGGFSVSYIIRPSGGGCPKL